ncbi:hypothetical protein GFS31_30350 [Leptolyngbya sp. BL0902]|uniref:hypothetical protein n=1 Tax=Leptolyngbya sp. BL0902 TaxID=1115757 RepID=UPI0018E6E0F4|nr:hypothetical protein [Leptolyngbya sp. BL0902]QQE66337.1 hypothetical protein GFS31_30350 [Leptolyngbya sp. BL0902]
MSSMRKFVVSGLVSLVGWSVVVPGAMASLTGNVDYVCYAELPGGSVLNLEHLCAPNNRRRSTSVDNGIINLRRGNDQLLREMQNLQAAIDSARTEQERNALRRQFEERLPYSDRVRQLQERDSALRQQLRNTTNEAQRRSLTRQRDALRQQIRNDPSHQAIRRARSEVFQDMNR